MCTFRSFAVIWHGVMGAQPVAYVRVSAWVH